MGFFSNNHFFLSLLLFTALFINSIKSESFKCTTTTNSPCNAIIDYVSPNKTTLSSIAKLFQVDSTSLILGVNDLPAATDPSTHTVDEQEKIKIPFPCTCAGGNGTSNRTPTYTVQPGDGLDHIAREVFAGLVTYQQIAAVNNIPDPNKINVSEVVWIPLPCSCDDVGGQRFIHYGHVVESGNTVQAIAEDYGTTVDVLSSLNNVTNLLAGQVLDVPLRVCNSSVTTSSVDSPLLVPKDTYVLTANDCVKCSCDSDNNWTLQCKPSGLKPANSTWSACPSMLCTGAGNLTLGNSTTSGCNTTTCSYTGFSIQTLSTALVTASTCPVNNTTGPNNYASSIGLSWKSLFISLYLIMLCVNPL